MGSQSPELHFFLIPLMSQSHLLPFTDMAKHLADRGVSVTIVMTPLNSLRFKSITDYAQSSNLELHFLTLPFPCKEVGLPEGCENIDSLPRGDLMVSQFFDASNMLQRPIEDHLEEMNRQQRLPSCIIADICFPWAIEVARRFDLPRFVFNSVSCFTILCSHQLDQFRVYEQVTSDTEPFLVPNVPDEIVFTKAQLPQYMKDQPEDMEDLMSEFKAAELSADGVVLNSFEELERNYIQGYRNIVKKVWCIGPLSLSSSSNSVIVDRGNKSSIEANHCMSWLNSKKPNSVLYVCFGSLCRVPASQLVELALGLESSRCDFIWVIRKGDHSTELERWLQEERFEERIEGRGLIIRGWAPQVLILSHPSVMGFMTHCGWNSTLEAVSAGVPMITWPMFAEQFYNEKLIVQVLKMGVRVGVEVPANWEEEDKLGVMVKCDAIRGAICKLSEGDQGVERRKRAKELSEMAKRAVREGGSSHFNLTLMIYHVMQLHAQKSSSGKSCVGQRSSFFNISKVIKEGGSV